ncbi:MAG: MASE1 domain-containing protein [Thermoplasmata archaeon]|nr:MASE1 domain-containing protein [Thermoplasmata archaeon]
MLLGAAYFVAGKAGLFLATGNASVSAVWPPTGIAIAALVLGGAELWPAVFVGAFFVNLTTTWDLSSTLGIASGNTMEGLVGAYLAVRYASGKRALERPQTVLAFALLSGFLASTIAATVGTTSLWLAHLARPADLLRTWVPYWLGDSIGAIEVGGLLLAVAPLRSTSRPAFSTPGRPEVAALGLITVSTALLVFARSPGSVLGGYPLVFLVLPPIVWAAFRFGPAGAAVSTSVVSVVAIAATVSGLGPFATLPTSVSLLALRVFIGSLALTALLVAADVAEHDRVEGELNHARKELQLMLRERTVQLDEARSFANVGQWTFDVASRKTVWTEEMYRIFGYGEERFSVVLSRALEHVHPDDQEPFLTELRAAMRSTDPRNHVAKENRYRLLLPGGERRTVVGKLQITGVEDGHAAKITGTVLDITERQRIEDELSRIREAGGSVPPSEQDFLLWAVPWMGKRKS